ncbi:MAG: DUF6391 domain-containing protein [Anaerolineaceae bacterium]|nr:DUF6391 domain-containing protein [Anaerolineaceae bacterium]
MTKLSELFKGSPFFCMRRNHALEHATLNLLARRSPHLRLAGYSDAGGFWVVGDVPIADLQKAAGEALARLQNGESALAIHANCGTNYVVPGFFAGTAAWLAMLGNDNDDSLGDKLDRWSLVILVVTVAFLIFRPFRPIFQQKVTTDARVDGMQIIEIIRSERGRMVVHRVLTTG